MDEHFQAIVFLGLVICAHSTSVCSSIYFKTNTHPSSENRNSNRITRSSVNGKIKSCLEANAALTQAESLAEGDKSLENETVNGSRDFKLEGATAPILNSFESATFWAEREEGIYKSAKLRLHKLKDEMKWMKTFVLDYEATAKSQFVHGSNSMWHLESTKDLAGFVASSGIASYRMIYRYVQILQQLKESMAINYVYTNLRDTLWKQNSQDLEKSELEFCSRTAGYLLSDWPNLIDLELAKNALIYIQKFYNYDYKQFSAHLALETRRASELNAFQCFEVGMYALYRKHFAVGVEWLEQAVDKIQIENDLSIPLAIVESSLQLVANTHNKAGGGNSISKFVDVQDLFLNPVEIFQPEIRERVKITAHLQNRLNKLKSLQLKTKLTFNAICSEKHTMPIQRSSKLYCWYDRSSSPARRIQPYKKELLSMEPEVIQVHDFLGEKLISSLLEKKANCSSLADTIGDKQLSVMLCSRTASSCWFEASPQLEYLWEKVSSLTLTDLKADSSHSAFQYADYLYGRFHEVHHDGLQPNDDEEGANRELEITGDRLYSMLFYLNDVHSGGWTSFANAGASAIPVKGSVVLWKNVYRNGSARNDAYHGSCPAIYGHKQIGIGFIHLNTQFRTYPCSLNSFE